MVERKKFYGKHPKNQSLIRTDATSMDRSGAIKEKSLYNTDE